MDGDYFSVWIGWVKGIFETLMEMTRGWVFGCVWNANALGMEMCASVVKTRVTLKHVEIRALTFGKNTEQKPKKINT